MLVRLPAFGMHMQGKTFRAWAGLCRRERFGRRCARLEATALLAHPRALRATLAAAAALQVSSYTTILLSHCTNLRDLDSPAPGRLYYYTTTRIIYYS